ncbi:MAG: glycosyl transferase [Deltaproteobacteria bacterium]|nr:MAG: glycosyl transferase [Deltaproteobacteria bacterium]
MPYLPVAAAFVLCLILTPAVRYVARANGGMAQPVSERWHTKPTALFGGIAIYFSIVLPLLFVTDLSTLWTYLNNHSAASQRVPDNAMLLAGATFLFVLGIIDDLFSIKPHAKLMGQILAASLVVFFGFRLHWFSSLTLDTMITMVWIVGVTNAFNLLDNMDGLCAGIGLICAATLAVILAPLYPGAVIAPAVLAAVMAGFLVYNFNPASIFMGDCGSLVIGFSISLFGLSFTSHHPSAHPLSIYIVPVLVILVPLLDTTMVTMVRLLSGRRASTGGRDHTSHRLVLMGFTERGAVLSLYVIGIISGLAAVFVTRSDSMTSPTVTIPLLLSVILMGVYLSQLRVYPEKEFSMLRGRTFTPVLIELTYKRQLVLTLLDFGLIAFAYYLSYRLRFDAIVFGFYFDIFLKSLPAVIICKLVVFYFSGVYRNILGHMSSDDVGVYLKASTLATLLVVAVIAYFYRFKDFSKGIFLIDWLLTTLALLGTRGFFRLSGDLMKRKTLSGETTIIYGAGRGGEILLKEILNNKALQLKPVGFIDDDTIKTGKKLQGYPILGTYSDLPEIITRYPVTTLLVSFSDYQAKNASRVKRFCRKNDLKLKQFRVQIQPVDLDDS